MKAIDQTRLDIINLIMSIDNIEYLSQIANQAAAFKEGTGSRSIPNVLDAVTTIRPSVSLNEIVAEQNYQPITYSEFRKIADSIGMEEPIEELLAMLDK